MKYNWKLYFDNKDGQEMVALYDLKGSNSTNQKIDEILSDHLQYIYFDNSEDIDYMQDINLIADIVNSCMSENNLSYNGNEQDFFDNLINPLSEKLKTLFDPKSKDAPYQHLCFWITRLSLYLTYKFDGIFYPILFTRNFDEFVQRCNILGIELPEFPVEKYRRERCLSYMTICENIERFRTQHALTKPQVCALIYGYAAVVSKEINGSKVSEPLPQPSHIWIVGASKSGDDDYYSLENNDTFEWQGGHKIKSGDIIILYVLNKYQFVHSVWRATGDSRYNPFDFYAHRIYIGEKIVVPHVTKAELKADPEASQMWMVKLNMAYMNGDKQVSLKEYSTFLRMMKQHDPNFDTNILPTVEGIEFDENFEGKEDDVTIKYLQEKLLPNLGYQEKDWVKELQLRLGRTIVEDDKKSKRGRPDITIMHKNLSLDQKYAPFVIEVKLEMKNDDEYIEALKQGVSYARMLHSKYLGICDKKRFVLLKRKGNHFKESDVIFDHQWSELENPALKQQLQDIIGKHEIAMIKEKNI